MFNAMIALWQSTSDPVFWASAILGSALFLIRIIITFIGGAFAADIEAHSDHLLSAYDETHHGGVSFKIFTLHSVSGFLMIFGWTGLAATHQLYLSAMNVLLVAFLCGFGMLIFTACIMKAAMLVESSGTVFSSKKTVGLIGKVYQRIPAQGQGKIQVIVDNVMRELLAQSHNHQTIESFTTIKIVKAIDHELVEVIEVEEF